MTESNDTPHPADVKDRSDDHQHAVEASEHALDALENGNLSHARTLLDEAYVAVESAQHDTAATQAQRETAFDCYD